MINQGLCPRGKGLEAMDQGLWTIDYGLYDIDNETIMDYTSE